MKSELSNTQISTKVVVLMDLHFKLYTHCDNVINNLISPFFCDVFWGHCSL